MYIELTGPHQVAVRQALASPPVNVHLFLQVVDLCELVPWASPEQLGKLVRVLASPHPVATARSLEVAILL